MKLSGVTLLKFVRFKLTPSDPVRVHHRTPPFPQRRIRMSFRFALSFYDYTQNDFSLRQPPRLAATGAYQSATGIQTTDGLLYGAKWDGTISYSFPDRSSDYETGYTEATDGFAPVSFAQAQAARFILEGSSIYSGGPRMALTPVEAFTNASLVDTGFDGADIRIGQSRGADPT